MKKIGIIGGGLAPYFNEAMANQMYILSKKLGAQVITCNNIGPSHFKIMGQYFIVNTKHLMNRTPIISFINGAILYTIIKLYERKFDTIIVPGGIDSEFLRYLNPEKCVPIVTSIPFMDKVIQSKIKKLAPKLQRIIVQSKKTKKQLIDMDVEPNKITLMYPLVDLSKFRYSEPPPLDTFRILFASSPNLVTPGEDNFRDKGVPLLLKAFKELIKEENATLYIVWRGKYTKELYHMIDTLGITDYVEIINRVTDMPKMYAKAHIVVIPFLNLWRSPEVPSSALESLACGRPVVATDVVGLAELIREYKCGCASAPMKCELINALHKCKQDYLGYQKNCRIAVETICDLKDETYLVHLVGHKL